LILPASSGWHLRSAVVNGRDVLDFPMDFAAAATDVSGAVLTLTDRPSELSGTFRAASGQAAPEFFVVVLPADRALWPSARRLKSTRPASDGRFAFSGLPAGDYFIAALTDLDPGRLAPVRVPRTSRRSGRTRHAVGRRTDEPGSVYSLTWSRRLKYLVSGFAGSARKPSATIAQCRVDVL
jgi:hypothetical protein